MADVLLDLDHACLEHDGPALRESLQQKLSILDLYAKLAIYLFGRYIVNLKQNRILSIESWHFASQKRPNCHRRKIRNSRGSPSTREKLVVALAVLYFGPYAASYSTGIISRDSLHPVFRLQLSSVVASD